MLSKTSRNWLISLGRDSLLPLYRIIVRGMLLLVLSKTGSKRTKASGLPLILVSSFPFTAAAFVIMSAPP